MSKPQLPALTHLQFLVLGVLRSEEQSGRTLREALAGYGIRRTGPAFYQLMARMEKDALVDGWYEQITAGDQLVKVRIVLPENIDDSLSYFFTEWRQKHGYDPGRK